MGFIDKLFNNFNETVFFKEDSSLEKQVQELKEIRSTLEDTSLIDKDIKLLELGIKGEKDIAFELKHTNIGLYVLRDITIEYEDYKVQIDYIIISKGFIYLVECKNLIGNIFVDSNGQFQREYELCGKKITEAIYSPYTQAQRHLEILKKRWMAKNSKFNVLLNEKSFDTLWYKPLVVLANNKSILDITNAPEEIKNNIVRIDQLVNYIKKDILMYDKSLYTNKSDMLELAVSFMELNVNKYNSFANKYRSNDEILTNKLKEFRKETSKKMNIPAYYVFTDSELDKIVKLRPKNINELKEILPIIKVNVHGEKIINIIKEC